MSQNQIIVPLARQLNWSHFPTIISRRSKSSRLPVAQSNGSQQANNLVEPFCWRQQNGLRVNEMFPDHFEELLDMDISGTCRELRLVQESQHGFELILPLNIEIAPYVTPEVTPEV